MTTSEPAVAQQLIDATTTVGIIVGVFIAALVIARVLIRRYLREDITDEENSR